MSKYLIYAFVAVFAFFWFKVVLDAGQSRDQVLTESAEVIKEKAQKAGRIVGDVIGEGETENEEEDNDVGDGEDDLDEAELDEDEILAEDWDEADDTEEEETIADVETTAKGAADNYEKKPEKRATKPSPRSIVTTSSNGRFLVIGGSFSSKGNANTFVKQLEKMGYEDAEIVVFDKAKKYHTVSVARFDSKTDASKVVGALKSKGIPDAYVHKKRG